MATGLQPPAQAPPGGLRWYAWPLRLAVVGSFGARLAWEWARWPDSSPLLGPLSSIRYNGADSETVAISVLLLAAVLAFPLRPRVWTGALSAVAVVVWLFLGALASCIGC
jgi:hypothetical protein